MKRKSLLSNIFLLLVTVIIFIPVFCSAEDFFPIGIFSVGPENLKIVNEAGFNTAHTYISDPVALKEFVEKAEGLGLKVLIYPGDRGDKGVVDFEKVTSFVDGAVKYKSILAWLIADEPELSNGSPDQIRSIHDLIKKHDPSRPTATIIHRSDRYKEYRDSSVILMTDRYPVPNIPLNHIAETTRWAVIQKGQTWPVWVVLQAFGYQNPQLKGWGLREPTYEEMRAMTFLSIIYGAKGVFYFTFTGSQYRIMESPGHWNDLKKIVREINAIYPLLLVPTVPHYNAPGWNDNGHVKIDILDGPLRDERGLLPVHLAEKRLAQDAGKFKAGTYFIAANATDKKVDAKFSHAALLKSCGIDVVNEGRRLNCQNGSFSDRFRPFEIHVYKTEKL